MRQGPRIGFPILPIERVDGDVQFHPIIETAPSDRKSILVRPRYIKALYPARLAEAMFRAARIECVLAELVRACQQAKARGRDNHMNIAAHRAD